jgi:hypothetical protein
VFLNVSRVRVERIVRLAMLFIGYIDLVDH